MFLALLRPFQFYATLLKSYIDSFTQRIRCGLIVPISGFNVSANPNIFVK